jgi:rod shape-determining protein MreD
MRAISHVIAAFFLMVFLGAVWRITPFEVLVPDVALIFALYLGISARSYLWDATIAVLMIGYLHDVLAGAPRGMSSLVLGIVAILCRIASTRLLLRGNLFVGVFTFVGAVFSGLLVMGIRVYFQSGLGPMGRELLACFGSALLSAVLAPLVFKICRLIDARFARTEREREAAREGYMT